MQMWEQRIVHKGLNAYRLIRGQSKHEVDTKASLQLAQWDARWQQKCKVDQRIADDFAGKALAAERTAELESQRHVLETLLTSVAGTDTSLDWETLKQYAAYSVTSPSEPELRNCPSAPAPLPPSQVPISPKLHTAEIVQPRFTVIERIVPQLRKRKVLDAEEATRRLAFRADELNSNEAAIQKAAEDLRSGEEEAHQKAVKRHQHLCDLVNQKNEEAKATYFRDVKAWEQAKGEFATKQAVANAETDAFKEQYLAAEESAVKSYFYEVLGRSPYPDAFPKEHFLEIKDQTLILDFELPNSSALPCHKEVKYVAARSSIQEIPVSEAWTRKTFDDVLYRICLRTMYELFRADRIDAIRSVVFNGWVRSIDRAVGSEVHACVMSLEAGKDEFLALNLAHVDPKACFKKLKGVSASKLVELSPVKPLVLLNKEDKRFVEGYTVVERLDERTNLAAMDWLDFENLIRELFEKEFSKDGGEVKITQASRDGGVDAIAFDPDPIRGGKLVIQAKRYTNTVGVSAVRDLYGTVHNEGANKGILVTTSDFGPDAYAFAKDKPLTLLSGGELLYLLSKHGHPAKIDIAEAKRLADERS